MPLCRDFRLTLSIVNFRPMRNAINRDQRSGVVHSVNNTPVAHADSPLFR